MSNTQDNSNNKNNNLDNLEKSDSENSQIFLIICDKCNNIIQDITIKNLNEIDNYICNNCGNIISNLKQVNILENIKETSNQITKVNLENKKDNQLKNEIKIDTQKLNNFLYLGNIVIGQNIKEIILFNFLFSFNLMNIILFLFIGGYLAFWTYKYLTLGAYLNQLVIFFTIFFIFGSIIYLFHIIYNSLIYKLSEKILLILNKNTINKNELKIINKPLLIFFSFDNLKNFLYKGFKIFSLTYKTNLKFFLFFFLFLIVVSLSFLFLIDYAISEENFYLFFCGFLTASNLFFFLVLFYIFYNNLIKQLMVLIYLKNKLLNNRELNPKEITILLNDFLKKNRKKILIYCLVFMVIYYLIIPIIQFSLILTGIGILFIYLPIIVTDIYFLSLLSIKLYLEDRN
jgi:hypothetical protein